MYTVYILYIYIYIYSFFFSLSLYIYIYTYVERERERERERSMLDDNIAFALMAWNASGLFPRPPVRLALAYLLPYATYHESRIYLHYIH